MLGAPSVPLNERDLALHVKQRDELAHMASNVLDAMMLNSSSSGGSSSSMLQRGRRRPRAVQKRSRR